MSRRKEPHEINIDKTISVEEVAELFSETTVTRKWLYVHQATHSLEVFACHFQFIFQRNITLTPLTLYVLFYYLSGKN